MEQGWVQIMVTSELKKKLDKLPGDDYDQKIEFILSKDLSLS